MKSTLLVLVLYLVAQPILFAQSGEDISNISGYKIIDSAEIFRTATFRNCHAVTIVETGEDTLLYAWFGGDYEGAKNVAIWGCFRYLKGESQWGEIMLLTTGQDSLGPQPCWNPVLFKTTDGYLFLDYKVGPNPREWWAERKISYDHGKTWVGPQKLMPPFLGPIKNKPIQLKDGTILYPSSIERKFDNKWQVHLESTNSSGDAWEIITIDTNRYDIIQPCILQYGNDSLQILCRSKQNTIVQSWSYDRGHSWSMLSAVNLPNPNSGIDAVSMKNGVQLLVYNPMLSGKDWWNGRSKLKVAVSKNGYDWKDILVLEDHKEGEYSYPAVIQDSRGIVHIAYTVNRTQIKFVDIE